MIGCNGSLVVKLGRLCFRQQHVMDEVFCLFSRLANKIFLGLVLVLSQHRGGPFLHGVHGKQCDEISVKELPAGCDKVIRSSCFTWSLYHSLGSLQVQGGSLCFSATVDLWFVLMNLRTRPMWGSSLCAFTKPTTVT